MDNWKSPVYGTHANTPYFEKTTGRGIALHWSYPAYGRERERRPSCANAGGCCVKSILLKPLLKQRGGCSKIRSRAHFILVVTPKAMCEFLLENKNPAIACGPSPHPR